MARGGERGVASSSGRVGIGGGGGGGTTPMPGWIGSIPKRMPPIPASFTAMRCLRACSSSSSSSRAGCPGPDVLPSASASSVGCAGTGGGTRFTGGGGTPNLIPPSFAMRSAIVLRRLNSPFPSDSSAGGTGDGVAGDPDEGVSLPLIGGGEWGIVVVLGDLDGIRNRGSIGSGLRSVSTRVWYRRGSFAPPVLSSNTSRSGARDGGTRFFDGGDVGPGAAVVVTAAYCSEPLLSPWLGRISVLRRDSMLLRPSGVGGAMEGLRVGVETG
jgi:hypothetical protein